VQTVDPAVEERRVAELVSWRAGRDANAVKTSLDALRTAAAGTANLMPATLDCARAGVTTGEWSGALREVFGEYRAPTGVAGVALYGNDTAGSGGTDPLAVREAVRATGAELGGRLRLLVGKPGLDGHSNGAEQVAVRARDAGFEVVYQGIRLTPAEIVAAAVEEDVHCVGLSVLSGSHLSVVPEVLAGLRAAGAADVPVVVGGIVPDADAEQLRAMGVADVFTPKDYDLGAVMLRVVGAIRAAHGLPAL
jgi:(2R)-ethylmalonyl-CoA mutase